MWIEFVVGSRPCSDCFSPGTYFLPFTKTNILYSNSTWEQWRKEPRTSWNVSVPVIIVIITIITV